jgi:hypothetical protein
LPEREREWVTPSEAQDEVIPPMTTREVPSLLSPRVAKAWGGSESSLPVEKLAEDELSCIRQHIEIYWQIDIAEPLAMLHLTWLDVLLTGRTSTSLVTCVSVDCTWPPTTYIACCEGTYTAW